MRTLLDPFSFLVVSLAGWMNQHLQYGLLCSTQSGSEFHLRIYAPGLDRSESNRQQRGYKLVVPVSQSLWARNGGTIITEPPIGGTHWVLWFQWRTAAKRRQPEFDASHSLKARGSEFDVR